MRNFKNEIIEKAIAAMSDTNDPKKGATFEKTVDVDFTTFNEFILTQWDNVTMETYEGKSDIVFLFYGGAKATSHVASYITGVNGCETKGHGVFGGTRVGSENPYNNTGVAFVKNPFRVKN
jgi:hypothetical protein